MPSEENEYLSLRIGIELKAALRAAAEREGRSIGNLVKHLIRQYCEMDAGIVRQKRAPYTVRKKR